MSSPPFELSPAARHQVVVEWNEPEDYPDVGPETGPQTGLLPGLVAARAAERPDAVALVAEGERVGYADLMARAEALAARLRRHGVGPESVVGVLLERSAAAVAVLLAIWRCGGAYLPLDPEQPAERLAFLLRDGLRGPGPRMVVADPALAARVPDPEVRVLRVDDAPPVPVLRELQAPLPDSPAYVIYTSGSTGRPKGIVVSHRALANRILWAVGKEVGPGDAFLHKTTLTFDVSLAEIFAPLAAGGRCVLAGPGRQRDLAYLAGLIDREAITHASFPPASLRLLLEVPDAAAKLRSLRRLITGGETVPADLPAAVRAVLPAVLYNRYGPTEATISVLTGICDPEIPAGDTGVADIAGIVPLGRPIARARVYLLDERLCLLPPGVPGEICIGGPCLARGYLGRPDLTAERFVPDPVGGEPGARLYRTGDRGRWRPDGAVEFLGRGDQQVKIRGFRVEIEEVEAALNGCPGVREAAVVACEDLAAGSRRLVAYVVPEPGEAFAGAAVRRFLAGRLAEFMIPSLLVPCAELPRMLSGKVDRAALVARAGDERAPGASAPPRTELERTLARSFAEVLRVPEVGVEDDFLAMGCNSLVLVRFQSRLRETLGAELALADVVRHPSVAALAHFLEHGARGAEAEARALLADAVLEPEIRPVADGPAPAAVPETVLLTGATGFLGAHLLAELLEQTSARILCLVRAAGEEQGEDALRRALGRYGLRGTDVGERVAAVPGDLTRPRLGLSGDAFGGLAATVDAIYHCGAQVNHLYPYEALRAANVEGTREVLRLTVQGRTKALHHVSTLGVLERGPSGAATAGAAGTAPEAPLDEPGGIAGGYRQSKWVAEKLVQTAVERGVPAVIYRPGWVTGSRRCGAANPADFLLRLIAGSLETGLVPDLGPIEVCPTPVDWVGAGIVWLSLRPGSAGRIFHLVQPQAVAYDRLVEWLRDLGRRVVKVPVRGWAAALADLAASGHSEGLLPLGGFLRGLAEGGGPHRFQPLRFASAETQAALSDGPLACPPVDRRLLDVYLSSLTTASSGSAPW